MEKMSYRNTWGNLTITLLVPWSFSLPNISRILSVSLHIGYHCCMSMAVATKLIAPLQSLHVASSCMQLGTWLTERVCDELLVHVSLSTCSTYSEQETIIRLFAHALGIHMHMYAFMLWDSVSFDFIPNCITYHYIIISLLWRVRFWDRN